MAFYIITYKILW